MHILMWPWLVLPVWHTVRLVRCSRLLSSACGLIAAVIFMDMSSFMLWFRIWNGVCTSLYSWVFRLTVLRGAVILLVTIMNLLLLSCVMALRG